MIDLNTIKKYGFNSLILCYLNIIYSIIRQYDSYGKTVIFCSINTTYNVSIYNTKKYTSLNYHINDNTTLIMTNHHKITKNTL